MFIFVLLSSFHLPAQASGNIRKANTTVLQTATNVVTKQVRPTDDTYVYGRGTAENGIIRGLDDMNFLRTYFNSNRAWAYETYLKFDLSDLNSNPDMIDRVVLKLYGNDDNGDTHTINLFDMSGTVWDEDNLNYTNIAATGSKTLITSITANMTTAQWYSWDITAYVKSKVNASTKVIALMLCDNVVMKKANGTTNVLVSFHSKENASGNAPVLEVSEKSFADLLLSDIKMNGVSLPDFQSTKYSYTVKLSATTIQIPVITATAANVAATVSVVSATSLTGTLAERTTKVRVSLNGQILEYQVVFEKAQLNNSTTLNSIKVNGLELDFFNKNTRNYNCYLPYTQSATQNPLLSFDAENPDQQISIVPAVNLAGTQSQRTAIVRVTSGDATATNEYRIVYEILPELDLYLLIGQSNMAGRGYINEALGDLNPINNTYLLTPGLSWEVASNPLNKYSSIRKELSMQRISPAYGFATEVLGKTTNPVGLIVNAQGGSSMAMWTKGSAEGLYEKSLLRAKEAQKWGKIKAILWHQGESNSGSSSVTAYPAQLKAMVDNFRSELNEPNLYFVAGELAYWRGGGTASNAFNNMIRTISTFIPNSDYVSAEGLTPLIDASDPHFDRASNIELGKRYASKVLEKIYSPTSVKNKEVNKGLRILNIKKKVVVETDFSNYTLSVHDTTGRLMHRHQSVSNNNYEVELKAGVYIVNVYSAEGHFSQKLLLNY